MENSVAFERKIVLRGTSLGVSIPPEILEYLNLELGQNVKISACCGKKGKFMAVFVENKKRHTPFKVKK